MPSRTEENYLKAIYALSENSEGGVNTNAIAEVMNTKASSVTDMIKKLADKNLLSYQKYRGVSLTKQGKLEAISIVRKHRLWESFLVKCLDFKWDEVHEIAEQLEHIKSVELINRIDDFLGNPAYDPHGEPIPDRNGKINTRNEFQLSELQIGTYAIVIGVKDHSKEFLKLLEDKKIALGTEFEIITLFDFDHSMEIKTKHGAIVFSKEVCKNLIVKPKL